MTHLGHPGDLLRLQQSADPAQVHLQDRCPAAIEQPGEIVLGGEPFAGRDRDRGGAGDLGHFLRRIGRDRLFEPQRIILLEPFRQPDCPSRGHLAVGAEQQVGAIADSLAQRLAKPLRQVERLQAELPTVEC